MVGFILELFEVIISAILRKSSNINFLSFLKLDWLYWVSCRWEL